ncbi:hypothetical protein K458DRAFT_178316 [Lentithecium fluviatile CBS 122367]|uniref:Uncharacterized protein n=1 Tax=Lentithecium fluviatile CBS 122367 TaxID=1168545 RepID=A0A6G1IFR0_9PLEO|nr:hypothetical protein K458DRAFT_178316 [Lentithecium fluviatile CBS 122367]
MLLTLSKPVKSEFEFKTHDYSPTYSSSPAARFSTKLPGGHLPSQTAGASSTMGTPHRGLPPPSAMALPDPGRGPSSNPLGNLPPAPSQWQGAEDGMKNWLAAKAEEEKRKQEEEKTKQENLKVEQRKIESSMLRDSIQGGVPPHLVPIIFAGIGGGNLANVSAEWIRDYQVQLQAAQQQQQQQQQAQAQAQVQSQLSPDLRREPRLIGQPPPGAFGAQPQTPHSVLPSTSVLPGQPLASQPGHTTFSSTSYASGNMSPRARAAQAAHVGAPTSAPRPPPQSQLPRLTTNEILVQQPPAAPSNVQQHQQSQPAQQQEQQSSSPSIYFHHWVPPTTQQEKTASGNPPATPSDYTSSPKKRKAQGGHAAQPPPTSAPQSYNSPSFSHISTSSASTPGRRGHARARSDASTRGAEGHGASLSRRGTVSSHAHTEAGAQYGDTGEHRFHQSLRGTDEQRHQHQQDPVYATPPQRNEGRNGQQAHAASSMAFQAETRQSGSHQHMDRGPAASPKREAGMQ